MGIVRGDGIVAIAGDVVAATKALLEHLVGETAASWSRCSPAPTPSGPRRPSWIRLARGERPRVEVEVHDGGQPLYPYSFGVE